jgi:predicted  nucleic acid-binding Zn-ribbon protein
MNTPFHLFQLQLIDSKIHKLDQRLIEIHKILKNDPVLVAASTALEKAKLESISGDKELRLIESRIHDKRNKLEQSEASLYGGKIKNPKELQDLQKEILSIKSVISQLEEEQLNLMLILEDKEKDRLISERQYNDALSNNEKVNAEYSFEIRTADQDKSRLTVERSLLIGQIPQNIVLKYEELRSKKGGVAVARVEDQTCTLCGTSLTPSDCQRAKSPSVLFYCPSCGRILYAD